MYGGKFASQNRLGQPYSWKEIYRFCFVFLCKVEIWKLWDFLGVNFWSRNFGGILLEAREIFLGFAFRPQFDHPRHFKFRVPPWATEHL